MHIRGNMLTRANNMNANARTTIPDQYPQRPSSAPNKGSATSFCNHSKNRQGPCQRCNALVKDTSTHRQLGIHSSGSLTKSVSFETPYGIVHKTSSSNVEPERIHSGTSHESFRREISMHKINAMPVLAEDGSSCDEDEEWLSADEETPHCKARDKSKIKKMKCNYYQLTHVEAPEGGVSCSTIRVETPRKKRSTRFRQFIQRMCSCTRAENEDEIINPEQFHDVNSSPQLPK